VFENPTFLTDALLTIQTQAEYVPRTKEEVIIKDDQVEQLVSELADRVGTELGGKIFVMDIPIAVDYFLT
jgi:nitrogen regulatory protein P-II 1